LANQADINILTQVGRKLDMAKNSLKKIRESLLMSKSELAREANVSSITITRIEEGKPCRMETKRKILLALGYSLSDAKKIFNE
jgi:DNA-binding XRE family transcriptional regulator